MRRWRVIDIVAFASALLWAAVMVLWVRSTSGGDYLFSRVGVSADGRVSVEYWSVRSVAGGLAFERGSYPAPPGTKPGDIGYGTGVRRSRDSGPSDYPYYPSLRTTYFKGGGIQVGRRGHPKPSDPGGIWVTIPYYALALVTVALPYWRVVTFRRRRAQKRGRCAKCGYDLRASEGRCPECGEPFGRPLAGIP